MDVTAWHGRTTTPSGQPITCDGCRKRVLIAAGVPDDSAAYVAGDQNDAARTERLRRDGRNGPA